MKYDENTWLFFVINKIIIVAVLAAAALWADSFTERMKSELTFANELAKERVSRIGEVWAALNKLDEKSGELVQNVHSIYRRYPSATDHPKRIEELSSVVLPIQEDANRQIESVYALLTSNRFWLGEVPYQQVEIFRQKIHERVDILMLLVSEDTEKNVSLNDLTKRINSATEEIEAARKSVLDYSR